MPALLQTVLNSVEKVKNKISPYLAGLLFYEGRKNCSSMASKLKLPVKRFYKTFQDAAAKSAAIRHFLISSINNIPIVDDFRALVIDATMLSKAFAKKIDSLSIDYDGVIRRITRGLSIVVAGISSGGNMLPLDYLSWTNKDKSKEKYKTKIQLAMDLITSINGKVQFDYIALDGAFTSNAMITFLEKLCLKFIMRIAKNRSVVIDGLVCRLDAQPSLKLVRNERAKTVRGFYQGSACFFTVEKRKKRGGGWCHAYFISNMDLPAKKQLEAYGRRWPIDKSFRTLKQKLGLKDCQMLSSDKQALHILSVFKAYSLATKEKIVSGKKSVEEVLSVWRNSK